MILIIILMQKIVCQKSVNSSVSTSSTLDVPRYTPTHAAKCTCMDIPTHAAKCTCMDIPTHAAKCTCMDIPTHATKCTCMDIPTHAAKCTCMDIPTHAAKCTCMVQEVLQMCYYKCVINIIQFRI